MQRTRIEWVKNPDGSQGYTWNPIKGLCPHDCWYCYARKIYERFGWNTELSWDGRVPLLSNKKPSKIFVCSTIEMFHPGIPKEWRDRIFQVIEADYNKKHTFQILTKFPQNIDREMPDNVWLGVSITKPIEMAPRIKNLYKARAKLKFVSFEPLMGDVGQFHFQGWLGQNVDWIIVGRLTGHGHKYDPLLYWIESIVNHAKKFNTPIFIKNNLKKFFLEPLIQEFPE